MARNIFSKVVLFFSGLVLVVSGPLLKTTLYQSGDPVVVGAGDIASCGRDTDEATAQLLDSIPGTVFTLGDNAYPNGTLSQFQQCYGQGWGRHKDRIKPSIGNHEYNTTGASGFFTYFGAAASPMDKNCTKNCKGYYSYDLGAWHIIVLNSEITHGAGSVQEQWLRADLAAQQSVCTLAYWHRPRFSSGFHGNIVNVQPFWEALYEYGADVVLNGNDHSYERFAPQDPTGQADPAKGIREFVVGTGGAGLYTFRTIQPNSEMRNNITWGVLKLTLHATSYDWEFIPIAGQSFTDTGSANCIGDGSTSPETHEPPPTDTPTPTDTLTPSPTATPTETETPTPSPTATPTETDTPTPTPTSTHTETSTSTFTPPPVLAPILADGFESENFSAWSSSVTDGRDLSVSTEAALIGSQGLRVVVDNNNPIYVTDDKPTAESHYRARFYFDPNSISMRNGNPHSIFDGVEGTSTEILRLEFRRSTGEYQLRARILKDNSTWVNTDWFSITDAPHLIELDWRASSAAGANNGSLTLWIDGAQLASLTGVNNDKQRIDRVRLGAVAGIDNGTRGAYYLDEFESWR